MEVDVSEEPVISVFRVAHDNWWEKRGWNNMDI
jgi:hypothetical protein